MKRKKIYFIYSNLFLIFIFSIQIETFAVVQCKDLLSNTSIGHSQKTSEPEWHKMFKASDLKPRAELWLRIRQSLEKHVTYVSNPLELAGTDSNKLGYTLFKQFIPEFPGLKKLIEIDEQQQNQNILKYDEFIQLKRFYANQFIQIATKPKNEIQVFAALEALKYLAVIESRIQFPIRLENKDANSDVDQKLNKEETNQDSKKPAEPNTSSKENKNSEPPQWNKNDDQYTAKNKNLGSKGKESKKNVALLLTNAETPKGLLRQKIYDQFNLNKWSSTPTVRKELSHEVNPSKILLIDPLDGSEIDIPVPYGYTLKPGVYKEYIIIKVGIGEFKLQPKSTKIISLSLFKINSDSHISFLKSRNQSNDLHYWPSALLNFTQSLKGLSPHQAAEKLEKYISRDGGFLYYSTGDKINKNELSKLDEKYKSLLLHMPEPMAMAHLGAFNCDGAASIGALLLRDVLGFDVRIAAGRTSAGTDGSSEIHRDNFIFSNPQKFLFHVVRSSDPSHAWIEVYENGQWKPFDLTPIENTPDSESDPNSKPDDLKKDETEEPKPDKTDKEESASSKKDSSSNEKNNTTKDSEKKVEELIKSKSTAKAQNESEISLIQNIIYQNELLMLEHLIYEGHLNSSLGEGLKLLDSLKSQPSWNNILERSIQKINLRRNEAFISKYTGLKNLLNEISIDFSRNLALEAKQKLIFAQKLLSALAEYRELSDKEITALVHIQKIISLLEQIKHKNSKEFIVVNDLLKNLPGNISKEYFKKHYGHDYWQVGAESNLRLAQDLINGKLKQFLQMGVVRDFVNMTLNSAEQPNWKEEPTLNRSLNPKSQQDLVVTRNPLDFARMLWNLRPGENMFAPTLQGRQFAIGSLESEKIPYPKSPIQRKISVIYYDISGSMRGNPAEVQDAILMAFVDKALSEVDALGRPIHEVYITPFGDRKHTSTHISSKEDALTFITQMLRFKTMPSEGNNYTRFIEEFYELITQSYQQKMSQSREKIFQKANMILLTDGIYEVNSMSIIEARKKLPAGVDVKLNFISIGDSINANLKAAATNKDIASKKPSFKQIGTELIQSISDIHLVYDTEAFATTKKISGQLLSQIRSLLPFIDVDPRSQTDNSLINSALKKIQITKTEISKLSGLKELAGLQKIHQILLKANIPIRHRQALLNTIIKIYPNLIGRTWKDLTHTEKDIFEDLKKWSLE